MPAPPPSKSSHYTLLIQSDPRSTPSSPQIKHQEEQTTKNSLLPRRHALLTLLLALALAAALLQPALRTPPPHPSAPSTPAATGVRARRKVLVRFNSLTDEGVGSAPQHFKSSILLADLLDREFVLGQLDSEHGYSTSDLFNAGAAAHGNLEFALPMCELQEQGKALWKELRKACASPRYRKQLQFELEKKYGHCGTLYHNVREPEVIQDLNGCVHGYFQRALRHPICEARWEERDRKAEQLRVQVGGKAAEVKPAKEWSMFPPSAIAKDNELRRVGVHMRWGDTQPAKGQEADRTRGITVKEVNAAIAILSACDVPLEVRVYGEGLPEWVWSRFTFKYQLVDSGDSITDLCRLGQSDVIVGGASGFAMMAHHLGRNKLQLVTDVGIYKYKDMNTTDFTVLPLDSLGGSVCEFLKGAEVA